jgi:16S rRNA (cytosine1402-N4)-methyltransferase
MHTPVLLSPIVDYLNIKEGGLYMDATFGGGGYARAILNHCPDITLIVLDRDPEAIERAHAMAIDYPQLEIHHGTFQDIESILNGRLLDGIVFDLGVSSFQIDDPTRGFSLRFDGPLDMRMSKDGISAADVVNTFEENDIADILFHYGDERKSRRIARRIVADRPFETTMDLVKSIQKAVPTTFSAQPPATKSFQALRIFVNNELIEIDAMLKAIKNYLKTMGRLVVVSFHSLEDRLVKTYLTQEGREYFRILTSKPIAPNDDELKQNPRARSAKLRCAERNDA